MSVYVGSARSDENGAAHGGKAGDQNGKEVSTQKWYKHSKGWRVIRATKPEMRKRIAEAMISACDNTQIGYDQWQRSTLYSTVKDKGFDPAKASVPCETDCSALVLVCVSYAFGKDIITPILGSSRWSTANMCSFLLKTGEFEEKLGTKYTDSSDYLLGGDILCTKKQGHTVVVLGDGAKASQDKEYVLGDRILKTGDFGNDVKELQEGLVRLGYSVGKYGADGDFGRDTESALVAFQVDECISPDGEFGTISYAKFVERLSEEQKPIEPEDDPSPIRPEPILGDSEITGGSVWLYSDHPAYNKNCKAKVLHKGDFVNQHLLSDYIPIEYNGVVYWVNKKYVKERG